MKRLNCKYSKGKTIAMEIGYHVEIEIVLSSCFGHSFAVDEVRLRVHGNEDLQRKMRHGIVRCDYTLTQCGVHATRTYRLSQTEALARLLASLPVQWRCTQLRLRDNFVAQHALHPGAKVACLRKRILVVHKARDKFLSTEEDISFFRCTNLCVVAIREKAAETTIWIFSKGDNQWWQWST